MKKIISYGLSVLFVLFLVGCAKSPMGKVISESSNDNSFHVKAIDQKELPSINLLRGVYIQKLIRQIENKY